MALAKLDAVYTRVVSDESDATKQLVDPYRVKKAQPTDLIELASEVQRADEEVRHVASGKLQIIAEQIKFLQQQARKVLEEAKESQELNGAQCNFVKKPGTMYYLYRRQSGNTYFSMLAPQEWANCPHTFIGAYRFEHDRSWTPIQNIANKDKDMKIIDNLMLRGGLPSLEYITSNDTEENVEK